MGIRKPMANGRKTVMGAGTGLAFLLAADAAVMTAGPVHGPGNGHLSAQLVTNEERLFLAARSLINQTRFKEAAEKFREHRERYPRRRYYRDAFYWEAYARHRMGQKEQALLLLDNMMEDIPASGQMPRGVVIRRLDDARQLRLRILGELAEDGDPRAAERVLRQSELTLGHAWDSVATVWDAAAWDSLARAMSMAWDSVAAIMEPAADSLAAIMLPAADSLAYVFSELADSMRAGWDAAWEDEDMEELSRGMAQLADRLQDWDVGFRLSRTRELPEHCEDESVQQEALTAVLRLVETNRVEVLRSVIDRKDECSVNLRVYAIQRLSREGTAAAERELIRVANTHPDLEARRTAASGLRRFNTETALGALTNILARAHDEETLEVVIEGLRRSENAGARAALEAFAANPVKPVALREDAIMALGRRDDVGVEVLIRLYGSLETAGLKSALIGRLRRKAESGNRRAETWLFNLAFDSRESETIRSQALDAWATSPLLELPGLVAAFGRLAEPDLRERMFYALYRKAERSRSEARSEVVRKMVELARLEKDREVRERAVYWLGRTGSPEAIEFLLELLRGPPADTLETGRSGLRK